MSRALERKYRDLLDREEGYRRKVWGNVLTVCLAYPHYYRTGMSNLGFQTIYDLINRQSSFLCERVFLPDPADEALLGGKSASLLSLESQRPLADFDILAFSLPYENDYPHILGMLDMGGIPLLAAKRNDRHPLVMGGGIAVTLNPEPLADFFDCFLLGEGEETVPEFLRLFADAKARDLPRRTTLSRIQSETPGAYVPSCYDVTYNENGLIKKRTGRGPSFPVAIKTGKVADIAAFSTEQCITTAATEFGNMFLVEASRGCRRGCRFCAAGFVYRPERFRPAACLGPAIERGIARKHKIGLMGTAVSDHPELIGLIRSILERKGKVAIASLRLDRVSGEVISLLKETGVETISLAPEAGSDRLRQVIRKGITEDQIFRAALLLREFGIPNLRLYFMVGLPTETDDDIEAIIRLTLALKQHAAGPGKKGAFRRITLSINQFIPKPATPFQWHPLADIKTVRERIRRIENTLRREKSLKIIHDTPRQNYIQALLSLGDRRVGGILLAVHENGGNWSRALKEATIDPDFYVYRAKDTGEMLPWDFIDHGARKTLLKKEYESALRASRNIKS